MPNHSAKKINLQLVHLKWLLFLLPIFFIVIAIIYRDFFFVILTIVSAGLAIILAFPKIGSQTKLNISKSQAQKTAKSLQQGLSSIKNAPLVSKITSQSTPKLSKDFNPSKFLMIMLTTLILIVVSTVSITYLTVFKLPAVEGQYDLITNYHLAWQQFFSQKWLFISAAIVVALLITSAVIRKGSQRRHNGFVEISSLWQATFLVTLAVFLSFYSALTLTVFFRVQDLKHLAQAVKTDPGSVNIYSGTDQIKDQLNKLAEVPQIKKSDTDLNRMISTLANNQDEKKSSFYNKVIIYSVPKKYQPKFELPENNMLMIGKALIIKEIKEDEFEAISPNLGQLLVTSYFSPRNIRSAPKNLEVLGRQAYMEFRNDQINMQLRDIDESIKDLSSQISSVRAQLMQIVMSYYNGEMDIDTAVRRYEGAQAEIQQLQRELAELKEIRHYVEAQKNQTPYELGIYLPIDEKENRKEPEIKVVLDVTNEEALQDYLAILTHEYLHYTSYIDDEKRLMTFFEEGLTEYFTREIMREKLGMETSVGYPLLVRVVAQMASKIDHAALAEAYFTKDQEMIKALLNNAYGSQFYEDSETHLILIPFLPAEKAIKYANDIMNSIGGEEITMEEIIAEIEKNEIVKAQKKSK